MLLLAPTTGAAVECPVPPPPSRQARHELDKAIKAGKTLEPTDYTSALKIESELLAKSQRYLELGEAASQEYLAAAKLTKKLKADEMRQAREAAMRKCDPDLQFGTGIFSKGYKWVDREEEDRRVQEKNSPVTQGTRSGRAFHAP
ncbi:hypothetical protein Q8F55_004095 [Vanrija albida]|uniref:DUF4398 domain-containing protein n=1 Tax=Vanrija albida TaxID=181172 RepID=A0ABR3Q6L5_9TREE